MKTASNEIVYCEGKRVKLKVENINTDGERE